MLKNLGKDINLDMTRVAEAQIKKSLAQLTKYAEDCGRTQQESVRRTTDALKKGGADWTTAIQSVHQVVDRLGPDLEVMERRISGINRDGRNITLRTDADGIVKSGAVVSNATLAQQKRDMQEINNLYKQEEQQLRAIWSLKDKLLTARTDSEADAIRAQIRERETLVSTLREERSLKTEGHNTVAKDNSVRILERELQLRHDIKASAEQSKQQVAEVTRLYQEEHRIVQQIAALQNKLPTAGKDRSEIERQIQNQQRLLELIQQQRMTASVGMDTTRLDGMLAKQQQSLAGMQELKDAATQTDQIIKHITKTIVSMVTIYATKAVRDFWKDAIEYAKLYYDQLNEIRIVSGMTAAEAEQFGVKLRKMARDMQVSSTDVAAGAVTYVRQGLPTDVVEDRLENTVRYAKIAAMSFTQASEIITSATNAMEVSAERAVDVFIMMGDSSATSAMEVGTAMQRTMSIAKEVGVSFEWLAAYISTISAKTRQAPETIGRAMSAIFSRLQSIKAKGFSEEDETSVNDVAKALDKANVAIMENSKWRDFSDILEELASKWSTLDDKTRAYIATTMAGTMQRDRMLTLMSDMARGAEGGSQAFYLYEVALNSAGIAQEKYQVYLESVQAAQGAYKTSLEELYATFLSGENIKGYYNTITGLVTLLTQGLQVTDGWTLKLPA